jgi:hypothetical protein
LFLFRRFHSMDLYIQLILPMALLSNKPATLPLRVQRCLLALSTYLSEAVVSKLKHWVHWAE